MKTMRQFGGTNIMRRLNKAIIAGDGDGKIEGFALTVNEFFNFVKECGTLNESEKTCIVINHKDTEDGKVMNLLTTDDLQELSLEMVTSRLYTEIKFKGYNLYLES